MVFIVSIININTILVAKNEYDNFNIQGYEG